MALRKTLAASLALAVAFACVVSTASEAQERRQTARPRTSAPQAPVNRGVYDDLSRYGVRDGSSTWLPGTTSPRVSGT